MRCYRQPVTECGRGLWTGDVCCHALRAQPTVTRDGRLPGFHGHWDPVVRPRSTPRPGASTPPTTALRRLDRRLAGRCPHPHPHAELPDPHAPVPVRDPSASCAVERLQSRLRSRSRQGTQGWSSWNQCSPQPGFQQAVDPWTRARFYLGFVAIPGHVSVARPLRDGQPLSSKPAWRVVRWGGIVLHSLAPQEAYTCRVAPSSRAARSDGDPPPSPLRPPLFSPSPAADLPLRQRSLRQPPPRERLVRREPRR